MARKTAMRFTPTPDAVVVQAAGTRYTLGSKSTSRSTAWGAWLINDFVGVFTWTKPGGIYRTNAYVIIIRRVPQWRDRLILRAVTKEEPSRRRG